uniref:G protein-coupled receptor 156 n=1 Tax=Leptobrachium leishanense TaxID=445787 RepID=A0A8C5PD11_9ANUR
MAYGRPSESGRDMESALNCTVLSQSHVDTTLDRDEALGVLQEVCRVFKQPPDSKPISAAVQAVSGSLLTCGLLLAVCFFIFILRFRGNRIVKMSSPNLNMVILVGSVLTYISGFLFMIQEYSFFMETIIQVRLSLLYLGVTLIFGPLLGKSWRLHKVFSHRVPDKRVIIKDLSLLALVALLLVADSLLLLSWVLSDPVLCVQIASASIRSADRGTSGAVTRINFCASVYPDLWIGILGGFKGVLIIYGSYLAGLTRNISSPPVNQSLVIMVGGALVVLGAGIVLVISRYFPTWPNLVYGATSGSIVVCTTTINCLIFIPQLLQWRQFEEEQSHSNVHMAKYFNSPSRSFRSMYSEEQIYHMLGENTTMRRLLNEKNAFIESLQEQVTSAKEKLVTLLNSEGSFEIVDDGNVNVFISSPLPDQRIDPPLNEATISGPAQESSPFMGENRGNEENSREAKEDDGMENPTNTSSDATKAPCDSQCGGSGPSGCYITPCSLVKDSTYMNICRTTDQSHGPDRRIQSVHEDWEQLSRKVNYVSSEKLQEILKELSVETLSGFGCSSPRRPRRASHSVHREVSSGRFRNTSVSISPSLTRRRQCYGYNPRILRSASQVASSVSPHTGFLMEKVNRNRFLGVTERRDRTERTVTQTGKKKALEETDTVPQINAFPKMKSSETGDRVEEKEKIMENGGLVLTTSSQRPLVPTRPATSRRSSQVAQDAYGVMAFGELQLQAPYTESDSSSSEETFCYCHRPYCDLCFPSAYDSADSCNSDNETIDQLYGWTKQPVVNFNEDLKPTLV